MFIWNVTEQIQLWKIKINLLISAADTKEQVEEVVPVIKNKENRIISQMEKLGLNNADTFYEENVPLVVLLCICNVIKKCSIYFFDSTLLSWTCF